MAFVVDTHAYLWHLTSDPRLGAEARKVLKRADAGEETIVVPTIVLSELYWILAKMGQGPRFAGIVERLEKSSNYIVHPLDLEEVADLDLLGLIGELHDRLIVATARRLGAELLTKDEKIVRSKYVITRW